VSPSEPSETQDVHVFARRLLRLSPRASQVVTWVALEGQSFEQAAQRLGIRTEAFEVLFLRAAHELALLPLPPSDAHEGQLAGILAEAWKTNQSAGWTGPLIPLMTPLTRIRQLATPIARERQALALAEEQSPDARRKDFVRRMIILVVIVGSAYLYWKQRQ
jgi:hypothetical protein